MWFNIYLSARIWTQIPSSVNRPHGRGLRVIRLQSYNQIFFVFPLGARTPPQGTHAQINIEISARKLTLQVCCCSRNALSGRKFMDSKIGKYVKSFPTNFSCLPGNIKTQIHIIIRQDISQSICICYYTYRVLLKILLLNPKLLRYFTRGISLKFLFIICWSFRKYVYLIVSM